MSSIFDALNGDESMTEDFIKRHRFVKEQWGNPHNWNETTEFYEKLIKVSDNPDLEFQWVIGCIRWFPPRFNGYTNFRDAKREGMGTGSVAGKFVISYDMYYWESFDQYFHDRIFSGAKQEDLENAMMSLLVDLESKDFIFIDK